MRLEALKTLGFDVIELDTDPLPIEKSKKRIIPRISHKMGFPLDLTGVNQQTMELVHRYEIDLVWVDKGILLKASTLKRIKQIRPKCILSHYNPDDPWGLYGKSGWRFFLRAIPFYDIHFVLTAAHIENYRSQGAQNVYRAFRGFCPDVHRPITLDEKERAYLGGQIGFIGSFEEPRWSQLFSLAERGYPVRIWGGGWTSQKNQLGKMRIENQDIFGELYVRAINSFDINLNFVRHSNRDEHNSRSMEIPACGGFLLSERTDELQDLFEEGKEAEYFGSSDELVDKVNFYLKNEKTRVKIAKGGRERCLRSGYDYPSRMKSLVEISIGCMNGNIK